MGDRNSAIGFHNRAVQTLEDKTLETKQQLSYQLWASAALTDPTFAEAYYRIGNANGDLHCLEAAIACYRRVLEIPVGTGAGDLTKDMLAKCHTNMGWRLLNLGRLKECREVTMRALELDPHDAHAHINIAQCESLEGHVHSAVEWSRKAYKLQPDSTIEMCLAFNLLFARHWASGLKHLESRFPYILKNYESYPWPKWRGEPGKTLYLVADQGLGDTLSYARFVHRAAARCKFVHLCVQKELVRTLRYALAGLDNVNIIPNPSPFRPADYWSTFVSLPFALDLSNKEIEYEPNISIAPYALATDWKVPDRNFHIGVAWRGNPLNEIDHQRSFSVLHLLELYRVPGIQLYSLQVGEHGRESHDAGAGVLIKDITPYVHDAQDTMGLLASLDLVITVESGLGHIAGAAEKECWIPYSYLGRDYRLGPRGEHPLWYTNHRVFQQGPEAKWEPVFERIIDALRERVHEATANKNHQTADE